MIVASAMLAAMMCVLPSAQGADPGTDKVPEPNVELRHEYGNTIDDRTIGNEVWTLDITEGDVTVLLMARNLTTVGTDSYWIDYQFNINYHNGGSLYIAQITAMNMAFVMGDQRVTSPLDSCDRMEMTHTPVVYVNGVPSLYCNITFSGIDVYADGRIESTYDLTLSHHVVVGWNQTDIKVEALFDLADTRLIDPSTGSDLAPGSSYAVELPYTMMLTLPDSHGQPIPPTGHSDTSLEYDLSDANGNPLRVSQLKMNNEFMILNGTGHHDAMGYSSMEYGDLSKVIHGFPGLVYGDTTSIKSDPEITVYYDALSGDPLGTLSPWMIGIIGVVAAAAVITAVILVKRKRGAGDK